jgi:poly-gamma-glutamate synthesis protein (capsule biosynthesis protein)
VTCSLPAAGHRPGDAKGPTKARPGVNVLRHEVTYTVPSREFDAMLSVTEGLRLNYRPMASSQEAMDRTVQSMTFLGRKFERGDVYATHTKPHAGDMELNLRWIRDARRMADWVVVSVHNHERGETADDPAQFVVEFTHAAIDAGADVVFGHGPHQDRGIEIYNGRPIVYALGDFILQNDVVEVQPDELYRRYGLAPDATPADLYDHRSGSETRGQVVQPIRWQSAVVQVDFRAGKLQGLKLLPVDLGYETHKRSQRGRPLLAEGAVVDEILDRFTRLSRVFGTNIEVRDGAGYIDCA